MHGCTVVHFPASCYDQDVANVRRVGLIDGGISGGGDVSGTHFSYAQQRRLRPHSWLNQPALKPGPFTTARDEMRIRR
jgi:hypothetical protein